MKQERIICDRCGKEIKTGVFPKFIGRVERAIQFSNNPYNYDRNSFELCGSCAKAFEKFMEGKK